MSSLSSAKLKNGIIEVSVRYRKDIVEKIREVPGAKWNKEKKVWSFPHNDKTISILYSIFGRDLQQISDKCKLKNLNDDIEKTKNEMRICGFSNATVKAYISHINKYAEYNKNYSEFNIDKIKAYLLFLRDDKDVSISYLTQAISSLKFFYCNHHGIKESDFFIRFPKRESKLPKVISKAEVYKILSSLENIKHRAMLMLVYSAGLRVSEVVALKLSDIESDKGYIRIRQSKGKKDRITLLSNKVLSVLREYYKEYKPDIWLFPGDDKRRHLCTRSVQKIFEKACNKASIRSKVSIHCLRHSFATHLLESGVDLRYIQELLGHESSKTTEIYTHVCADSLIRIKNPLDDITI